MPNYCEHDFWVKGEKEELCAFLEFAREGDNILSANKFIPYPEKFRRMDEKCRKMEAKGVSFDKIPKDGFNSGGYEWCNANWGEWDWGLGA